MFSKILIANRGEIACRVIETAQRLGIKCVAVYSEADSQSRHVAMADEAFLLGPAPSSESYLRIDAIIEAALVSGAQAIHPGYGFLSENTDFADRCEREGIVFIGPPSSAIAAMGSKSAAKAIMERAGVPLVPGYHGDDQDPELLRAEAERCGYPLLLKAVAGGGGKGMRVVEQPSEFDEALQSARREASNAFGNPDMLIERYLTKPRHVEIQVFCDSQGNGIYLAERDCSLQRRHQKVIEEAPAPGLAPQTRQAMGESALAAAHAINYCGAGTVEFLYDEDGSFYFMEMNTRLQVEHPVTEMITGLDLVEWQLRIASGEPLPLQQSDLQLRGHALEARVYAEDPDNDFLPVTGTLEYLRTPTQSAHVRVDTGVLEGDEVSVYYDPMIAKLIVWDESREAAINRLVSALEDYRIGGMTTNVSHLRQLANSQAFRDAQLDTGFIEKYAEQFVCQAIDSQLLAALACSYDLAKQRQLAASQADNSPFTSPNSWRLNARAERSMQWLYQGETLSAQVRESASGWQITLGDSQFEITAQIADDKLTAVVDGHRYSLHGFDSSSALTLYLQGQSVTLQRPQADYTDLDEGAGESLTAPMNGAIVAVLVAAGDLVKAGQTLVVMEAMKMEHAIKAPCDATVSSVFFAEGELVDHGAALVALEESEDD